MKKPDSFFLNFTKSDKKKTPDGPLYLLFVSSHASKYWTVWPIYKFE